MEPFLSSSSALLGTLLTLGSIVQWLRFRHCAYHLDTGYWVLITLGFFHVAAASIGLSLLPSNETIGVLAGEALMLLGLLYIIMALLRLFSWRAHRHTSPQ